MKDMIGKSKINVKYFPRMNDQDIFSQNEIASEFNTYFVYVGSKQASKIPNSNQHFQSY